MNIKQLILMGFIALSLTGCNEKETGLEKKVINAAYESCLHKLTGLLKSPSSLKVGKVSIYQDQPNANVVLGLYHDRLIDKEKEQLKESYEQVLKPYYRTLGTHIEYDAQNSFGTMLRGQFFCEVVYELYDTGNSSDYLEWSKIIQGNEVADFATGLFSEPAVRVDKYSNWTLNSHINHISALVTTIPNDKDKTMLQEVFALWQKNQATKQSVSNGVGYDEAQKAAEDAKEAAQEALAEVGLSATPDNK